jgi:hypothetical protein
MKLRTNGDDALYSPPLVSLPVVRQGGVAESWVVMKIPDRKTKLR